MKPLATVAGVGWVTPLGNGVEEVRARLAAGESAPVAELAAPHARRPAFYRPIPPGQADAVARSAARVRRSSPISCYALTAGLAALQAAGEAPGLLPPERASQTAVIFAVCSGGVNYTRRFYEKIVAEGPAGASPILFPETVYNAPASHLAALLGVDGPSYTLVGDASAGFAALRFAGELLATDPGLAQCIVVGAEEADWILWQGYAAWRLLASEPCVRLHAEPPGGMLLSEGAAAMVLRRPTGAPGEVGLLAEHATYLGRREAGAALGRVLGELPRAGVQALYGSANGTWVDAVEAATLARSGVSAPAFYPKGALGDPLGAAAILQAALAAEAVAHGEVQGALATGIGLNQQVGAALVQRAG